MKTFVLPIELVKMPIMKNQGTCVHSVFVILTLSSVCLIATGAIDEVKLQVNRIYLKAALAPSSSEDLHQNNVEHSLELYDDHETEADQEIVFDALERAPLNTGDSKQDGDGGRIEPLPEILNNDHEKKYSKDKSGDDFIAVGEIGNVKGNEVNKRNVSVKASEIDRNDVVSDVETDYKCSQFDKDRAGCLKQAGKKRSKRRRAVRMKLRESDRSPSRSIPETFRKSLSQARKVSTKSLMIGAKIVEIIPQDSAKLKSREDKLFVGLHNEVSTENPPLFDTIILDRSFEGTLEEDAPTGITAAMQYDTVFEEGGIKKNGIHIQRIPSSISSEYQENSVVAIAHKDNPSRIQSNVVPIVIRNRRYSDMNFSDVDSDDYSNELNRTYTTLVDEDLEDSDTLFATTSVLINNRTTSKPPNPFLNQYNREIYPRCFMNHDHEIYVKVNQAFPLHVRVQGESAIKLNCTKRSPTQEDSDMPFEFLDDFTIEVNIIETEATSFYLDCSADGSLLCSRTVYVGHEPLDVEGFDCISHSWAELACWYTLPYNPAQPTSQDYQICIQQEEDCDLFSPEKLTSSEARSRCPGVSNFTECWLWNSDYPFASPSLSLNVSATNDLGSRSFIHTINNYAKVLPSRPTDLSASSPSPSKVLLFWKTPGELSIFPAGLQYRINISSPYSKENVSGWYEGSDLHTTLNISYSFVNYSISVELRSGEPGATRWSEASTSVVQTAATAPVVAPLTLPGMFQVSPTDSLRLYWQSVPQALHGGPLFSYLVKWSPEDGNGSLVIVNRTYMDLTVQRHSSHRFLIFSTNSEGMSQDYSEVLVAPTGRTPPAPTFPAAIWNDTRRTFFLRWYNKTAKPANYTLYYCAEWASPDTPCKTDLRFLIVGNSTAVNISLGDLQPPLDTPSGDSTGAFAVSAQTEEGGEEVSSGLSWSPCTIPYSDDWPDAPALKVANISDSAALLQWGLPCHLQAGVITGVQLKVCDLTNTKAIKCDGWMDQPVWATTRLLTHLHGSNTYHAFIRVSFISGFVSETLKPVRFTTAAKSLEWWQVAVIASAALFGTAVLVVLLLYSTKRVQEKYKEATGPIKTPNFSANIFSSGGNQNSQDKRASPSQWAKDRFNKASTLSPSPYMSVKQDDGILKGNDAEDEEANLLSQGSSSGENSIGRSDKESPSNVPPTRGLPMGNAPPNNHTAVDQISSKTVGTSPDFGLHYSTIDNDEASDGNVEDAHGGEVYSRTAGRSPGSKGYSALKMDSPGPSVSSQGSTRTGVKHGISSIVYDPVSQFPATNESQDLMSMLVQKAGLENLSVEDAFTDGHALGPTKLNITSEKSAYVMAGIPRLGVVERTPAGNYNDQSTKINFNDDFSSVSQYTQGKKYYSGSGPSHSVESVNTESVDKVYLHETQKTTGSTEIADLMTFLAQQAGFGGLSSEDVFPKIHEVKSSGMVQCTSPSPYIMAGVSLPELNLEKGGVSHTVFRHGDDHKLVHPCSNQVASSVSKPPMLENCSEYQTESCPDLTINRGGLPSSEETQKFMSQLAQPTGLGNLSIENIFPNSLNKPAAANDGKIQNSLYVMTGIPSLVDSKWTKDNSTILNTSGNVDTMTGGNLLSIKLPPNKTEMNSTYTATGSKEGTFNEINKSKSFTQNQHPYVTSGVKKEPFEERGGNKSFIRVQPPYITTGVSKRTFEEPGENKAFAQIQSPYVTTGVKKGSCEEISKNRTYDESTLSHTVSVHSDQNFINNEFSSNVLGVNLDVKLMPTGKTSYDLDGCTSSYDQKLKISHPVSEINPKTKSNLTVVQIEDNAPQFVWLSDSQATDETVVNVPGLGFLKLSSNAPSHHHTEDKATKVDQSMANSSQRERQCLPELPAQYCTSGTKEALEASVSDISVRFRPLLRRHHSSVDSGYVPSESESSKKCGDRWSIESHQISEEDEDGGVDPFDAEPKSIRTESVSLDFDEDGEISTDYLNYILTKYQDAESKQGKSFFLENRRPEEEGNLPCEKVS